MFTANVMLLPKPKVSPSGLALASVCEPMMPPALAKFSTITGCPKMLPSRSATGRMAMSGPEPAAYGTMKRIGLVGQPWAETAVAAASAATARSLSIFMRDFLRSNGLGERVAREGLCG